MEIKYCDGKIPGVEDRGAHNHVQYMTFILNCMSRYRDLHIHGLLDTFQPEISIEYLWSLGLVGPFGRVFRDSVLSSLVLYWTIFIRICITHSLKQWQILFQFRQMDVIAEIL
jgi:hypothetical protein